MADYALACPVCQGPMYDQKAPGNKFPYVAGRPIAVCKNKKTTGCTGVYWEPKGQAIAPSSATAPRAAPPTTTYPQQPTPALKSVADDCGEYVFLAFTLALSLDKAIAEAKNSGDKGAADLLAMLGNELQAATATIYIQRQRR
jgi:hypothetical protein